MSKEVRINIARDFAGVPGGRLIQDGPFSGEEFRESILSVALQNSDKVIVELDGTEGYGSSFLEEAFGGLIRKNYLDSSDIGTRLIIEANADEYRHYQSAIFRYMKKAIKES